MTQHILFSRLLTWEDEVVVWSNQPSTEWGLASHLACVDCCVLITGVCSCVCVVTCHCLLPTVSRETVREGEGTDGETDRVAEQGTDRENKPTQSCSQGEGQSCLLVMYVSGLSQVF